MSKGLLDQGLLDRALCLQKEQGGKLGDLLVSLGYITPEELAIALVSQQWIDTIDLQAHPPDTSLIEQWGPTLCRELGFLPLESLHIGENLFLRVALADRNRFPEICQDHRLASYRIIPYLADPELLNTFLEAISPPAPAPETGQTAPDRQVCQVFLLQKGHRLILSNQEGNCTLSLHSGTQRRAIQNAQAMAARLRTHWRDRLQPQGREAPAGGALLTPDETGLPISLLLRRRPRRQQEDLLLLTWSPESSPLLNWTGPGDRIRREGVKEAVASPRGLFMALSGPEDEPDELLFALLGLLSGKHILLGPELLNLKSPGPWLSPLSSDPLGQELARRALALHPDNLILCDLNHQIYAPTLLDFAQSGRLIVSLRADTPLQALQILSAGHGVPLEQLQRVLILSLHQRRLALLCPDCRRHANTEDTWRRGQGCARCHGSGLLENRRVLDVIPGRGNPDLSPLPPRVSQTAQLCLQRGLCSPTDAQPLVGVEPITG